MLQNICLTCKSNKTCCILHIYTNSKMLSFQRQKLSSKLQNVQIISIEIFLQGNLWFKLWLGGYHCAIILRYLLSFVVSQQELKRFHLQIFIVCWSKWWTALSSKNKFLLLQYFCKENFCLHAILKWLWDVYCLLLFSIVSRQGPQKMC